jgi:hypothetical protein
VVIDVFNAPIAFYQRFVASLQNADGNKRIKHSAGTGAFQGVGSAIETRTSCGRSARYGISPTIFPYLKSMHIAANSSVTQVAETSH